MFGSHVTRHLSAYLHGELPPALNSRVESHLRECAQCRTTYEEVRFGSRMASLLTPTPAPESIWDGLSNRKARSLFGLPQLVPTIGCLAVVAAFSWLLARNAPTDTLVADGDSWEVESLRGSPRIQNAAFSGAAELRPGQTLQTDGSSEAEVRIASIGRLTVDPNTRIRLVITKADEHRIALDHGKVEAITWAPPRLFIVDTPSARAVDLGCMYTLDVQKDGSSLLHVTLGMVSLASHGRESFVPAYDYAHSRPGFGPGTPFHQESSEAFKAALDVIDFGSDKEDGERLLDVILSEARKRDATTLWHLLSRVGAAGRTRIFDRLAEFVAPPASVSREGILALDPRMVRTWGEAIPELFWMTRDTQ